MNWHLSVRWGLAAALALSCSLAAMADQALATKKNCMGCHAMERKMVGPSYKDVAKKYAADPSATDKLALKIQKGGAGVWGPVAMPSNPQVNEKEAQTLASWVLSLK
jgi:cytochrome c